MKEGIKKPLVLSLLALSIFFTLSSFKAFSKQRKEKVKTMKLEELRKLSDQELVKKAVEALKKKDKYFFMNDYLKTEVTKVEQNVVICFRMLIQYFPMDDESETEPRDIRVGFGDQITLFDPYDENKRFKYHLGSEGGKKALQVLLDTIKKDERFIRSYSRDYDLLNENEYITIRDGKRAYEIGLRSDGAAHGFEIDKKSGKCDKFWHEN